MKKYIIFLLLLMAAPAWAVEPIDFSKSFARLGPIAGAGVAAASCSTPSGDELSEGFNAVTDVTWVKPVTQEGHTVTYGHDLQSGDPTGSCTKGVNIVLTSTGNRERIYWDRGSAIDRSANTIVVEFSIYFNSINVADGNVLYIFKLSDDNEGTNSTGRLELRNVSGTYSLRIGVATPSTAVTVTTGTWYVVKIHYDATAASSYLQITGGGSTTCDVASECGFTTNDIDPRYAVFGKAHSVAQYADFEIGYVTINTP